MLIKVQQGNHDFASFHVGRVGSRAGDLLDGAYTSTNSFSVHSDNPGYDGAKIAYLYAKGIFNQVVLGTCQPAIRKRDFIEQFNKYNIPQDRITKYQAALKLKAVLKLQLQKVDQLIQAI